MPRLSDSWREPLLSALRLSGAPVAIRSHGAPRNAPSPAPSRHGSYVFRTWGRVVVELRPMADLTPAEVDAMQEAIRPFVVGGMSIYGPG